MKQSHMGANEDNSTSRGLTFYTIPRPRPLATRVDLASTLGHQTIGTSPMERMLLEDRKQPWHGLSGYSRLNDLYPAKKDVSEAGLQAFTRAPPSMLSHVTLTAI
jgi:hypothetical protein